MKKNSYILNTFLAALLGLDLLVVISLRTFLPNVIIPELSVTDMVLFSMLALLLDSYVAPEAKRCYICIPVFAALTFGLLPLAACMVTAMEAVKLAVIGAVVFTAVTWMFTSMTERIATGPKAKAAPVISAFGIYLAAQCLMGMF